MGNIFLSVLGISVSIGFMVIGLILLTPFLNKRYAAKWKYLIWIFLAIRLLIPFSGTEGQYVLNRVSQLKAQTVSGSGKDDTDHLADGPTPYRRIVVEMPAQMTAPIKVFPEQNNAGITMLDMIALVWISGSLIFIAIHLLSYSYYKRQVIRKGRVIYEGTGAISDLTVKGLSDADEKKIENGKCTVSIEFRDSNYEDMFLYLTFIFVKEERDWKIQFYGLEG